MLTVCPLCPAPPLLFLTLWNHRGPMVPKEPPLPSSRAWDAPQSPSAPYKPFPRGVSCPLTRHQTLTASGLTRKRHRQPQLNSQDPHGRRTTPLNCPLTPTCTHPQHTTLMPTKPTPYLLASRLYHGVLKQEGLSASPRCFSQDSCAMYAVLLF